MVQLQAFVIVFSLVLVTAQERDLVLLPKSEQDFWLVKKTELKVGRVDEVITISCIGNKPWRFCRWTQPDGSECDLISIDKYDTACPSNPRVRSKRPQWYQLAKGRALSQDDQTKINSACSITIQDLSLSDHGSWRCHLSDDPVDSQFAEEEVQVIVASPYELVIKERSPVIKSLINSTISEEAICVAKGKSELKPQLQWVAHGKHINPDVIDVSIWEETNAEGDHLIYQSLNIDTHLIVNYLEINASINDQLDLRCIALQKYPNGSILYESAVQQTFEILEEDDLSAEGSTAKMNMGGTVIVIILAILLAIVLTVICYAQKKKKWCYKNQTYKRARIVRPNQNSNTSNTPEATDLIGREGGAAPPPETEAATPTVTTTVYSEEPARRVSSVQDETRINMSSTGDTPPANSQEATPTRNAETPMGRPQNAPPLPPLNTNEAPPINEILASPVTPTPPTSPVDDSKLTQNNSARLLELINSPPPIVPDDPNQQKSMFRLSLSLKDNSEATLSDSLTSRRNLKRRNEYVKDRPQSREVLANQETATPSAEADVANQEPGNVEATPTSADRHASISSCDTSTTTSSSSSVAAESGGVAEGQVDVTIHRAQSSSDTRLSHSETAL